MSLGSRDRRALAMLGVALLGILAYTYWPEGESAKPEASGERIAQREKMMLKLRQPGRTRSRGARRRSRIGKRG